jgi:hypothetical protein
MLVRSFNADLCFCQALALSEDLAAKRAAEVARASKNAEVESVHRLRKSWSLKGMCQHEAEERECDSWLPEAVRKT